MQDSYQLPDNQEYPQQSSAYNNQPQLTNQPLSMMMTSIISPKNNRRLAHSYNTASQQSLAYSNSTYHNKLTQRSPPLFNLDFLTNNNNDQNVNTLNYCYNGHGNKNQLISTFGTYGQGSRKGMAIKFDRITEQSGIESQGGGNSFFNSNNANNKSTASGMMINDMSLIGESQQLIELPCFLSLENSPQNMKMASNYNNNNDDNKSYSKDLEQMEIIDMREVLQKDSITIPMKMKSYKKVTPSSLMMNRMDKQNEQNEDDIEERQLTTTRRGNRDLQSVGNNKKSNKNNQRHKLQQKKFNNNSNNNREIRTKTINLSSSSVTSLSKSPSPSKNNKIITNNSNSNKKKATNNNNTNNNRSQSQQQQQQFISQKQRIRQLQYELRTCEIQREQLRTRVGILNELLQENFLQHNSLFMFKNYNYGNSKVIQQTNYQNRQQQLQQYQQQQLQNQHQPIMMTKQAIHKNIDLLVQMTIIKRENDELKKQNDLLKHQMDNFITNNGNQSSISIVGNNNNNREKLLILQQKSIQVNKINNNNNNFIDKKSPYQQQQHYQQQFYQLKQQIQHYQQQKTQTKQTISLLEQKQTRFQQVQRPKLLQHIKQLMEKINQQKDMIEKLQMENNLIAHMKSIGSGLGNESPQRRGKQIGGRLSSNEKQSVMGSPISQEMPHSNKENSSPQQKFSVPQQIDLLALQKDHQLSTLKKQRDYFHSQYSSLKSLQQTNYRLRLKIQDLQNQLSSIKQLIEVDDQITF